MDFGQYYADGLPHADGAAPTLHTNFTATARLTDAVLPLLNKVDGRIVFVASEAGTYGFAEQPPAIRERVETATREELTTLADEFVTAVTTEKDLDPRTGYETSAGWKSSFGTYGVSKMLLIRYSASSPPPPVLFPLLTCRLWNSATPCGRGPRGGARRPVDQRLLPGEDHHRHAAAEHGQRAHAG